MVRLSDCIKCGLFAAFETTERLIEIKTQHSACLEAVKRLGKNVNSGKMSPDQASSLIGRELGSLPAETQFEALTLTKRLHTECLTVVTQSCFALESYVNSLGYHLLKEMDLFGLVRAGHEATVDDLLEAIDRLNAPDKWKKMGKLKSSSGFDSAAPPFQDLQILFKFRNDVVHDKVRGFAGDGKRADDYAFKRYGGKLPDIVFGFLELKHAAYAADTYWAMILKVHELASVPIAGFHGHYNLSPWDSEDIKRDVRIAANRYAALTATV